MSVVVLDGLSAHQEQSWRGILGLSYSVPRNWCLVGGRMVYLLCRERGTFPPRPTEDADAVLDVRARPGILGEVTAALLALGFQPNGESWEGHQHRWVRESGQIDILIARGVGERAGSRRGATSGTVPETPGAQGALDRAEAVDVRLRDTAGTVWRPGPLGAIALKAAAAQLPSDRYRKRHLIDLAVLATLLEPADVKGFVATGGEKRRIATALGLLAADRATVASVPGADEGLARLAVALGL